MTAAKPTQEFGGRGNHRLIAPDGKTRSTWTPYTGWVSFQGWVGVTDYYISGGGVFTPQEFVSQCGNADWEHVN